MTQWESHRYPPPGKLVDIGGLRLHINCIGAGSPTVIMESGPKAESAWMEMQGELRSLSSRSQWIIAKGSNHWVQIYRPELVVDEVQEIVNDARGTAPFQADLKTEYK